MKKQLVFDGCGWKLNEITSIMHIFKRDTTSRTFKKHGNIYSVAGTEISATTLDEFIAKLKEL